jgi:hypothetical protein
MSGKLIPIRDANVCREPTLADMLADPIVKAVMRADGVDAEDVEALFRRLKPDAVALRAAAARSTTCVEAHCC